MGFWFLVLVGIVVGAIVLSAKAKKKRRQKGLEQAIRQAHKTGDWEAVDNYCVYQNITDEEEKKTRKLVMTSLAEEGDLDAVRHLSVIAETAEENYKWLLRLAEAGDTQSMYMLGLGFSEAINAKASVGSFGTNPEKEYYWYSLAADRGHEKAMAGVAECYYYGIGVAKDRVKAFEYAKDGVNRGNSACCFFLATNFSCQHETPHITTTELIKLMERVMLRGEPESFAKAAWKLGMTYGRAYVYSGTEDEYSDRRKAAYCFTLAHVLDPDMYDKDDIFKTGYRPSQFELNKWQEDARNLRYNPTS